MLFVILAGIAIFVESLLNGWDHLTNLLQNNIWLIISMLILSAISRSCPLYLRNDQAFDISVISTVALYLCVGTRITIILYVVSTLITFEKCADGTVKSLYNMDLKKTLFNVANIVLSIAIPGLLCHVFGVSQAGLVLPNVLLKAVIFSVSDQCIAEHDALLSDGYGFRVRCLPPGGGLDAQCAGRHAHWPGDCADL